MKRSLRNQRPGRVDWRVVVALLAVFMLSSVTVVHAIVAGGPVYGIETVAAADHDGGGGPGGEDHPGTHGEHSHEPAVLRIAASSWSPDPVGYHPPAVAAADSVAPLPPDRPPTVAMS